MSESEHIPQTSADPIEYVDQRGLKVADSSWDCPNCGDGGELMHRPGSKNTCTKCLWVRNGNYNDHVLRDWPFAYRDAQQLLLDVGRPWSGTPGDIANRLHAEFDRPEDAVAEYRNRGEVKESPITSLSDFE